MSDATEVKDVSVRTDYVPPQTKAREGEEVWAVQVPGAIHLKTTSHNRFGQTVEAEMAIGPNRVGHHFRIKTVDREENQARCYDPKLDPFRNGMLVRIDGDQQADPATASPDALGTEELLDIFDLELEDFKARVQDLGEVTLRRLAEVGEAMDCSHKQITYVRDLIEERYTKGGPQASLTAEQGERLS